ncbi:MAG TPA: hypothetical protein VK066_31585 [Chloroflexota bacterium]|nr:hypothetical protein [Chloroflexota bacterium]
MRRVLVAAALSGLLLTVPRPVLALDYAEPSVPEEYGISGPAVMPDTNPGEQYASPQTVPDDPPFVPHNTWDNQRGGCALWDWDTC